MFFKVMFYLFQDHGLQNLNGLVSCARELTEHESSHMAVIDPTDPSGVSQNDAIDPGFAVPYSQADVIHTPGERNFEMNADIETYDILNNAEISEVINNLTLYDQNCSLPGATTETSDMFQGQVGHGTAESPPFITQL